jgi:hypothetical protein
MVTPIVIELGRLSAHQGVKVPTNAIAEFRNEMSRPTPSQSDSATSLHPSRRTLLPDRSRRDGHEVAIAA